MSIKNILFGDNLDTGLSYHCPKGQDSGEHPDNHGRGE
ncbi:hypothetical protein NT01EI_3389 [Edwardsiella ictaluri 93-146]|uniref:Uncharacterized protein n=1 Tax=Edwardsiella ictaluri (strain 93-146) TaxID=634503 RepID=C5BAX1_EDWI9|nr:hypothetical protein NT01EI_3389 [Edwardsiella ictaluri 93-146]